MKYKSMYESKQIDMESATITIESGLKSKLDCEAGKNHLTRSGFISYLLDYYNRIENLRRGLKESEWHGPGKISIL